MRKAFTSNAVLQGASDPLLEREVSNLSKVSRHSTSPLGSLLELKSDDNGRSRVSNLVTGGFNGGVVCGPDPDASTLIEREAETHTMVSFNEHVVNFGIAFFSVFMGATDGLALGSLVFPHDDDHPNNEYRAIGMNLGLFTAFMANLVGLALSGFPHCVGGLVMPVVPIMANFFATFGPENCATVMVAMPLMTLICGILTYVMGRIGVQGIVKACPFVVFGGFIAGTGAQLIECGLNMMYPKFQSFTMIGETGWGALAHQEFWVFCGPGLATALFIFLGPRCYNRLDHPFLLPGCILLLTVAFYVSVLAQKCSIDDLKSAGWLFGSKPPTRIDFFKIWTSQSPAHVRWDLLASPSFVATTMQVFLLGFLTTAKNVYGTAEVTHWPIDIDKEIRSQGVAGIMCGLTGGLPGNIVMSFSVTAHKLGVRKKVFSWWLMVLSLAFFLVGEYIIAFLPKMIPACVLLWLGFVLVVFFLWDLIGTISVEELSIIISMTIIDMIAGAGVMIVVGLFATLVITVRRMMAMKFIVQDCTIKKARSDVLRADYEKNCLVEYGDNVIVLALAQGYFSFINASVVLDRITDGLNHNTSMLIIDFKMVLKVGTTALNTLKEIVGLGVRRGFWVVLAGCSDEIVEDIVRFGIKVEHAITYAEAKLPRKPDGRLIMVDERKGYPVPAVTLAAEFAEDFLIDIHIHSKNMFSPELPAIRRTELGEEVKNSSLDKAREDVVMHSGVASDDPALALLVDMHCWLNGYFKQYDIKVLSEIAPAFEVRDFAAGEFIYDYNQDQWPNWELPMAGMDGPVPPLVWLLRGEVEHLWTGHLFEPSEEEKRKNERRLSHFEGFRRAYDLKPYQRLEKAKMPADNIHHCLGYFQTTIGFFGNMMHAGRLVSTTSSSCILLGHKQYSDLTTRSPDGLKALTVYLNKKRFVLTSIERLGNTKLMM